MRVILVEDNDNTAYLTELYFQKMGFSDNIDRTYRIKPFEHLVDSNKYGVAIIDYHLQVLDAPEFIKKIKDSKLNSNTPIIVVSHELDLDEQRQVEAMGVHYVRRHDDYQIFVEIIIKTLRKMN